MLERQERRLEMVLARRDDGHAVQIAALSEKAVGVGIAFRCPNESRLPARGLGHDRRSRRSIRPPV